MYYRPTCYRCLYLLDVTQQSHASQYPVVGVAGQCWCRWSLEGHCCDVGEVSAAGLLVHGALVQLAIVGVLGRVHRIQVDHWEGREEDLGLLLHQTAVFAVPASPVLVQPVHVHAFSGWGRHLLLDHLGDIVVQDHRVQSPPLVSSGDLLPHGSEEALRVEETSHPEHVGSPSEDPSMELGIPLQKFSKPEPKSGGLPRHLHTHNERGREHLADVNYLHCFSGIKPPPSHTHTHTPTHII